MRISPGPREHIFVDGERSGGDAELWESQSRSKTFQVILGQWQGSKLSHAKPGLERWIHFRIQLGN